MICKKCGSDISENMKFCGYCGEAVQMSNQNELKEIINEVVVNNSLKQTIQNESIQPEVKNAIETSVQQPNLENSNINNQVVAVNEVNQTANASIESKESDVSIGNITQNQNGIVNNTINQNNNKKNNNKIFIMVGIILTVIAVILLTFSLKNSSESSISALEKAIANLKQKNVNSITVAANLSMGMTTGETFDLTANVKAEKKDDNQTDMQITINKSLLFDEMNIYASTNDKQATLYIQSNLIDMLGFTSSVTSSWLYHTIEVDELLEETNIEENEENLNLEEFFDSNHFKRIDKKDNINHYQLIIDQELINQFKEKANEIGDQELNESVIELEESFKDLNGPIKFDLYITDSNEFSKIELDLSNQFTEEDGISKFIIGIEISDLGNTKVEIPSEAKNSIIDLETYMTTNVPQDYNYYSGIDTQINSVYGF